MDSSFHMICNTIETGLCVHDDQGRLISVMTSWRQPCTNVQEGHIWNFNHVVFELDYKMEW